MTARKKLTHVDSKGAARMVDVGARMDRAEYRGRNALDVVRHKGHVNDFCACRDEVLAHRGAALIGTLAGRTSGADGDDSGPEVHEARYVPDFPPVFSTRRTSVNVAPRSTDFSMS